MVKNDELPPSRLSPATLFVFFPLIHFATPPPHRIPFSTWMKPLKGIRENGKCFCDAGWEENGEKVKETRIKVSGLTDWKDEGKVHNLKIWVHSTNLCTFTQFYLHREEVITTEKIFQRALYFLQVEVRQKMLKCIDPTFWNISSFWVAAYKNVMHKHYYTASKNQNHRHTRSVQLELTTKESIVHVTLYCTQQ